jgi:hypothetical protein
MLVGPDNFHAPSSTRVARLISDWTYFHCPGTTLLFFVSNQGGTRTIEIGPIRNQNLIFWPLANNLGNGGQQKIKIVHTSWQSNLRGSCQSLFSLFWHHPSFKHKTNTLFHFKKNWFKLV